MRQSGKPEVKISVAWENDDEIMRLLMGKCRTGTGGSGGQASTVPSTPRVIGGYILGLVSMDNAGPT